VFGPDLLEFCCAELILLQPVLPRDLEAPLLRRDHWKKLDVELLTYALPSFRYPASQQSRNASGVHVNRLGGFKVE
jgi:hypothetical protein